MDRMNTLLRQLGRESLKGNVRRGTALLFGFAATIAVGCAQVYFLLQAGYEINESGDFGQIETIVFAFFFFGFSCIFVLRYLVILGFAFVEGSKRPNLSPLQDLQDYPPVSILIPAYNELENIEATIRSAVSVEYPNLEVIVVDDGSTDGTYQRACWLRDSLDFPELSVYRVDNGGKSRALNTAFERCSGEFVMSMDADSALDSAAILFMVSKLLANPNLAGCAGQVTIGNTRSVVTYLQQLEYVQMNGTGRMFQSYFNTTLIAPGPITLFRRTHLEDLVASRQKLPDHQPSAHEGPWESDTFAEDAKLSMSLLSLGYGVCFEPAAECTTQSPPNVAVLLNQRYRWVRGNLQAVRESWKLWSLNSERRPSFALWLLWFLLESVAWPLIDLSGAVMFVYLLTTTEALSSTVLWYLALIGADLSAAAFACMCCNRRLNIMIFIPLYRMFYGLLLEANAVLAMFDESRRAGMRWN